LVADLVGFPDDLRFPHLVWREAATADPRRQADPRRLADLLCRVDLLYRVDLLRRADPRRRVDRLRLRLGGQVSARAGPSHRFPGVSGADRKNPGG
jgi:hypothetical protein